MKRAKSIVGVLVLVASFGLKAQTFCSMTFNSPDEKISFNKNLSPLGYKHVELVPQNKDPEWFSKACKTVSSCDILVVSGHFGGLFFGEQSSSTISLEELTRARELGTCPSILDKPKAVYLMGCNTLSSKSPDHRSVNDYLRVLVGDGFPLSLAEEVAAARYLSFGQSMAESMSSIFNKSQMVVGFESTGPLGAQAAPRLERAFKESSMAEKKTTGLGKNALLSAFKGTNLRVVKPEVRKSDELKKAALSVTDSALSLNAWRQILKAGSISENYDFLIKNQNHPVLVALARDEDEIARNLYEKMLSIYQSSKGLSEIQVKVLGFMKLHNLIDIYTYEDSLLSVVSSILSKEIDYISADQLCTIVKKNKETGLLTKLSGNQKKLLLSSSYGPYLRKCAGEVVLKQTPSKAYLCLLNRENHDWGCLTSNPRELDIEACTLAKSRNADSENADDMMWYCYSQMNDNRYLTRAGCLELTHQFNLLGNQIKMNWNCLNRVSK